MREDSEKPGLTPFRKAVFGLGDQSVNIAISSLSLVYFTFLVTVAGLDPWRAGLIAWLARLVDGITDPLMGRISDRTRWRLGRRRPFFLMGMIPLGVFFSMMWMTPFQDQAAMFVYYLSVYIGLALSITVVSVPYMALIPEMASDYDERTSLNTYRSAAAVGGTMVAAGFFGFVQYFGGGSEGFGLTGLLIGIWLVLPWPFVFLVSFEKKGTAAPPTKNLRIAAKSLLRHGTYLRLCFFYVTGRISMDLLGLSIPLFITIWLGRPEDVHWVLLSMLTVVILSLPIWLRVARKREKHQIFAAGSIWLASFLIVAGLGDPTWPRWTILMLSGILGIGYAVVDLMPWAMVGEVIDENEFESGERADGTYNGTLTFLRKVGGASAYMLAGFALSFAGYERAASEQSEGVILTIRLLATLLPALFLLLGLLAVRGYPLTRERHLEILEGLRGGRSGESFESERIRMPGA